MKRVVLIIITCFALIGICSCQLMKPVDKDNQIGGGTFGPHPHFFTGILKANELIVQPNNGNGYDLGETDRTALLLLLSGDAYLQFSNSTMEEFKKLANQIGDTANKGVYYHATPADNLTTSSAISAISINALSQYNASHPIGSSLKDIIQIDYHSFDYVFFKESNPTAFNSANLPRHTIKPDDDFTKIKYPALLAGNYFGVKGYRNGLVMSIEFLKAPSTPKQEIQVILHFENGLELKKEVTVDIVELGK